MFDQQNLNARQARWFSFLSEYEFKIKHIKGKENKVVDDLTHPTNLLFACSNWHKIVHGNYWLLPKIY